MQISGSFNPAIRVGTDKDGRPCAHILLRDGSATIQVTSKARLRFLAATSFAIQKLTWSQWKKLQGEIANLRELPNTAPSLAAAKACACGTHIDLTSTDGDKVGQVRSKSEGHKTLNVLLESGMLETKQEHDMLLAVIDRSRLPEQPSNDPRSAGDPSGGLALVLLDAIMGGGMSDGLRPRQPQTTPVGRRDRFGPVDPFDDGHDHDGFGG